MDARAPGTVLKSGGKDEPALAFLSCLVLQTHRAKSSMRQLQGHLLQSCPHGLRRQLEGILTGSAPCAVLLNERLINVPEQLLAPLHEALHADLAWARENEGSAALRAAYDIGHFVCVVRCEPAEGGAAEPSAQRGARGEGKRPAKAHTREGAVPGLCALRSDDELLRQAAMLSFPLHPTGGRPGARAPRGRQPAGTSFLALVLTAQAYAALPSKLRAMADQTNRDR